MSKIYDFIVQDAQGKPVSLSTYKNKILLVVNTASKCGFTPQYEGLEALQKKYEGKLQVLAFPCNQFGGQEPGENAEIQEFCQLKFHTNFPVFGKINVNGADADPLFVYLKEALPGLLGSTTIKWNFTKFLIDQKGAPLERFAPKDTPDSLAPHLEKLLLH